MKHLPLKEQLLREQKKNEMLSARAAKNAADLDYIAMMCDVELETAKTDTSRKPKS